MAAEGESAANCLAFVFAVAAFAMVLEMIVVQLAVGGGIGEITRGLDEQTTRALRRGLRMIDLGLDVAWDMLIGSALIFSGVAIRRRSGLGLGWAIPSVVLGIALIVLNAATFPWPPSDHGLIDIGSFIGLFGMALAARLTLLGRRVASWECHARRPLGPPRRQATAGVLGSAGPSLRVYDGFRLPDPGPSSAVLLARACQTQRPFGMDVQGWAPPTHELTAPGSDGLTGSFSMPVGSRIGAGWDDTRWSTKSGMTCGQEVKT